MVGEGEGDGRGGERRGKDVVNESSHTQSPSIQDSVTMTIPDPRLVRVHYVLDLELRTGPLACKAIRKRMMSARTLARVGEPKGASDLHTHARTRKCKCTCKCKCE